MEDEPILTEAALEANSRFIIPFATRKFRQRIFFPPHILAILPSFVKAIVGLHERPETIPAVLDTLTKLKQTTPTSTRFIESLDEIAARLQSNQNLPKYVWELAADLAFFYSEILTFIDSSLKLVNQSNEVVTQELTVTVPRLLAAVEKGKPEGARDPIRVSLLLGTPDVMKQYEQYARSQSQLVRKCPVCGEPATWFAFPCSHELYCDECKALDEAESQLPTVCPVCGAEITKIVRVPLPE
jgi:hypothetical protein